MPTEVLICIPVLLLLAAGVAAVFLPGAPTPLISWLGVLLCYFAWQDGPVGGELFLAASLLTVSAHIFEFVGSYFGAKRFGATWRGGLGAFLGGVAGMLGLVFLPVPGGVVLTLFIVFAGPFVGAVAGELLGNREWRDAAKSGVGTLLGNLAALLVKLAVTLAIFAGFVVALAVHLLA
jgi:uncharacterized protein YqgC (DUF456 family)